MDRFIIILVSLFISNFCKAGVCAYRPLKLKTREGAMGRYPIDSRTELRVEEGQDGRDFFDGPIGVFIEGKKKCEIRGGGIYSAFYLSATSTHIMTNEYSGSCGENRVFEIATCKFDSIKAEYCGEAKLESGNSLVNAPYCEPLDEKKKLSGCSTAHVYTVTGECKLKFDESASRKLTKQIVGVELPMSGSHNVLGTGTSKAKIVQ